MVLSAKHDANLADVERGNSYMDINAKKGDVDTVGLRQCSTAEITKGGN